MRKRIVLLGFIAVVFASYVASAHEEAVDAWPEDYHAVARVRVRVIDHSLLLSDVRRVEHGAPPPYVPYEVRLDVLSLYPDARLPRIMTEGVSRSLWMPEVGDIGYVALRIVEGEHVLAAAFPNGVFLPERSLDSGEMVIFPPGSGVETPTEGVWECLRDLVDIRNGSVDPGAADKWNARLREAPSNTALLALYYLLRREQDVLDWDALGVRMMPGGGSTADTLSVEALVFSLPRLPEARDMGPVIDAVSRTLASGATVRNADEMAHHLLRMAFAHPDDAQERIVQRLFLLEYGRTEEKRRLIHRLAQLKPFIAERRTSYLESWYEQMLNEPWRFPFLRTREDVELLWNLLFQRGHSSLEQHLRGFLKEPTPDFLKVPVTAMDIQHLVNLAQRLLTNIPGAAP